jgi:hypothetical protein
VMTLADRRFGLVVGCLACATCFIPTALWQLSNFECLNLCAQFAISLPNFYTCFDW